MVEGARLESEYTPKAYRGFESLPLRHFSTRPGTPIPADFPSETTGIVRSGPTSLRPHDALVQRRGGRIGRSCIERVTQVLEP